MTFRIKWQRMTWRQECRIRVSAIFLRKGNFPKSSVSTVNNQKRTHFLHIHHVKISRELCIFTGAIPVAWDVRLSTCNGGHSWIKKNHSINSNSAWNTYYSINGHLFHLIPQSFELPSLLYQQHRHFPCHPPQHLWGAWIEHRSVYHQYDLNALGKNQQLVFPCYLQRPYYQFELGFMFTTFGCNYFKHIGII